MISVAENHCGTSCDGSVVEIKSNLDYHYYGGHMADVQGYYKGKFDERAWMALANQLEKIDMDTLKSDYAVGLDEWFAEIIIQKGGKIKHIIGDTHLPKTLSPAVLSILHSYKTTLISKTGSTYHFETMFQKPAKLITPRFPPAGVKQ